MTAGGPDDSRPRFPGSPGNPGPTSETLRIKLSACEKGAEPTDAVRNKTIEIRLRLSGMEGVDHSGGHDHDGNRPLGRIESGGVGRDCTAQDADACMITCVTGNDGTCTVKYTTSEFSGGVVMNARYPVGEGAEQDVYILVGLGLIQLPDSPDYVKVGGTGTHAGPPGSEEDHNHWGTVYMIAGLQEIARRYREATGDRMVINDISLPRGGQLDICGTWDRRDSCASAPNGGHSSHRVGRDVDIRIPTDPAQRDTLQRLTEEVCDRQTHGDHWHLVCVGA